jgi:hypothetical protein
MSSAVSIPNTVMKAKLRLDADAIFWLRQHGRGYLSLAN